MTDPRDTPLRGATQEQLVEELARRLNENGRREAPPEQWCDDCVHFQHGTGRVVDRKNYNPCKKRHQMQFYVPQPWDSPECFGYYVEVCADREARPEPPPPAPKKPELEPWMRPEFRMEPPPRGGKPTPAPPPDSEDCPE